MGVGADCDLRTGDKANEGESERIAHGICRGGLNFGCFLNRDIQNLPMNRSPHKPSSPHSPSKASTKLPNDCPNKVNLFQ